MIDVDIPGKCHVCVIIDVEIYMGFCLFENNKCLKSPLIIHSSVHVCFCAVFVVLFMRAFVFFVFVRVLAIRARMCM